MGYGSSQSRANLTKPDGEVKGLTMSSAGVKVRGEDMKIRGPALTSITCGTMIEYARGQRHRQSWKAARTPHGAKAFTFSNIHTFHVLKLGDVVIIILRLLMEAIQRVKWSVPGQRCGG